MYLAVIKNIYENNVVLSNDYFIRSHIAVEGYLNRLIFIGLRKNRINYKQSQEIIKNTFIRINESLEKGLELLDKNIGKDIFEKDSIQKAYNLFLEFSARYRNKIEHGVLSEINDKEILKMCISINVQLIREIEYHLMSELGKSAFDEPKKWGAERICNKIDEKEILAFKIGKLTKAPIALEKAIEIFSNTQWKSKNITKAST